MRKIFHHFLIIFSLSYSQSLIPKLYKMKDFAFDSTAYKGLKSNMVSDIVQQGDTVVWLGTGSGLACLLYTSDAADE